MTRIAKLNQGFISGAALDFAEFRQILEAYGFSLDRVGGSHHIYRHPKLPRPLPITPDGKAARRYQMRQARDMIERYRLQLDEA